MPRKPRSEMSPEELRAFREGEAERSKKRRDRERLEREARAALAGDTPPKRRTPRKAQEPSRAPKESAAPFTQEPPRSVAPAFSMPQVPPRTLVRAGQLAGQLEALFASGGTVALAAEDDARQWLGDTPIARSVVSELLTVAGWQDAYEDWAASL